MTILRTNFKRILRKPINIIMMLVVPIILNLIIITLANQPSKYNVELISYETTDLTEAVAEAFGKEFSLNITDDEDKAKQAVLDGYADYLIVIPEGFTQAALCGDAEVQSYSRQDDDRLKPISVYVSSYVSAINQIGKSANAEEKRLYADLEQYTKGIVTVDYQYCTTVSNSSVDNAVNSLGYVAVGMVYFIVFSTMLLFEDKKCGVADRLHSSPVNRLTYFFQHLLSYLCLAAVQIVIMIVVIPLLVDVQYGEDFMQKLKLFAICLLFAAACISIGITISVFSKNTVMANSLVSMVNVPMLMLGGCFWPASIMPEGVQKVAKIMPTTWFLSAARGILRNEDAQTYILQLLLGGFSVLLLLVACFGSTNMSGQFRFLETDEKGKKKGE